MSIALAALIPMITLLVLGTSFVWVLGHKLSTFIPSIVFPNVGNIGLPLCFFAFGQEGLALGVAYFMAISIAHFGVGRVIGTGEKIGWHHFLKIPILWCITISIVMIITQWQLPVWLDSSVMLIGNMAIPLMLIIFGASLASLKVTVWKLGLFYGSLRMILGAAAAVFTVILLKLEGNVRSVVIVMGVMPVAIFNDLFALRYNCHFTEITASMVMVSTLLALLIIPVVLYGLL